MSTQYVINQGQGNPGFSFKVSIVYFPDSTCGEGSNKVEWYLVPTMNLQRRKFIPKKGDLEYNR